MSTLEINEVYASAKEPPSRRRILLVSVSPILGGAETYLVKLARLLSKHHDVRAIVAEENLATALREARVTLEVAPLDRPRMHRRYIHVAYNVWRSCQQWDPDLLHLNGQAEAHLAFLLSFLRTPSIIVRHSPFNQTLVPRAKQPLVLFEHRAADAVLCVSETLRRQLAGADVPNCKLHHIPNWVEPKQLSDELWRPHDQPFRILFTGRLVRLKGALDVIKAMRNLDGVVLDVVGDGPQRKALEIAAAGQAVNFHGFQRDCVPFYDHADLVVFTSLENLEGHPQVPLEAMARGTPCLLSDIESSLEISDNGRCAALFRCGDPEDLARQIRALQQNPERLHELRVAGLERVKQVYTEDAVRDRYLALYESVIQEHALRRGRKQRKPWQPNEL